MATIKSYTSLEQSKKLAEILPLESADHFHIIGRIHTDGPKYEVIRARNEVVETDKYWPCWSLAALFGVLPNFIRGYGKCLYYDDGEYYCGYMADGHFMLIAETKADNQIDACYEMIIRLHELKML